MIFSSYTSNLICGRDCSFVIDIERDIYSFGFNEMGKLGNNNLNNDIFLYKICDLSNISIICCGYSHTICLDYEGNVYVFGSNFGGKLGINESYYSVSIKITPQILELPSIKYISCGFDFSMCISNSGIVYSFGDNRDGQLGLGHNNNSIYPQIIPDLYDVDYIVCGSYHTICKTFNNNCYTWGNNSDGRLGIGTSIHSNKPILCSSYPDNIISIKCGIAHSILLTSEGNIYSFGRNSYLQLGFTNEMKNINIPTIIEGVSEIQRIECGYHHNLCIDNNNNLWLFGHNYYGQLGIGSTNDSIPIIHPSLIDVIDISSGGNHSFIKTSDNKIFAFGKNDHNQLGIEPNIDKISPIEVFKYNNDIWSTNFSKSRAKSARK